MISGILAFKSEINESTVLDRAEPRGAPQGPSEMPGGACKTGRQSLGREVTV